MTALLPLLLTMALAGTGTASMPPRPPGLTCSPSEPGAAAIPQRAFLGVWQHPASTARFRVCIDRGVPIVTGVDSGDGEVFRIQDARLEGNRLFFTSTMPSTAFTLQQEWRAQGPAVLVFTHEATGQLLLAVPE